LYLFSGFRLPLPMHIGAEIPRERGVREESSRRELPPSRQKEHGSHPWEERSLTSDACQSSAALPQPCRRCTTMGYHTTAGRSQKRRAAFFAFPAAAAAPAS